MTRRILLPLLLLAALPLIAQPTPDPDRKTGFTFSVGTAGSDISLRRRLSPEWTALAAIGYSEQNAQPQTAGPVILTPYTLDVWSISAGARRYFASDELRPFAEVTAGMSRADFPGCSTSNSPRATIGGGVEYYVARRVSIEGSAGLGYSETSQSCGVFGGQEYRFEYDSLNTFRTALSVTFYF